MANIPTASWDETKPAGTRDVNLGDDDIREFKTQVREIINADHEASSSGQGANWGHHNIITLLVQTTITALADAGKVYSKDVSGKAELHYLDEDGNEIQITTGGKLNAAALKVASQATGDLLVAASATAWTRLGIGTTGQVLRVSGGTPVWGDQPVSGEVLQVVNTQSGAVATGTTAIPIDDTIPQITEGTEFITLAITPKSATNKLKIDVVVFISSDNVRQMTAALFQDSTANALAVGGPSRSTSGGDVTCIKFTYYMTSGTTSSTTFRVRAGTENAVDTMTFNGQLGGRLYGGVLSSSITITEIQA